MRGHIDIIVDMIVNRSRMRAIESIRDAQANEQDDTGLISHNSITDDITLNKEQNEKIK